MSQLTAHLHEGDPEHTILNSQYKPNGPRSREDLFYHLTVRVAFSSEH